MKAQGDLFCIPLDTDSCGLRDWGHRAKGESHRKSHSGQENVVKQHRKTKDASELCLW